MCSGTIGIGSSGRLAFGFFSVEDHRPGVRRGDLGDLGEVGAPGAGLGSAVDDPVVGVGDVRGGEVLAVGPLHAVTDVERPGQPVVRRVPVGGQPGLRGRHVGVVVADHVVVGQRPRLERRHHDAEERVERVHLVAQRDREGDLLVGGVRGRTGREREAGHQAREQQSSGGDETARSTLTPVTEPVPPVAPREPFEHTEHGVPRPDPYRWMHADTPALTEYLSAERSFHDSSVAHLHPLVSTLKSEMFSRLAPTEVSARWRRTRFSYYTVHLAGNDYEHIFREIHGFETDSKQISSRLGRFGRRISHPGGLGAGARRRLAGGRQRLPRPRRDPRQPGREPARLLRRHHRRGGLRAPLPRPAHRGRPRRGGAAQLLPRRLERGLGVLLLHRPRPGLPAAPGLAAPDRHPGRATTCWCSRSPTSGSS